MEAVQYDTYPLQEIEGVFGVQMEPQPRNYVMNGDFPIGALTYCVWQSLSMCEVLTKEDIAVALLEGCLPTFFEERVRALVARGGSSGYIKEMLRRNFKGIKWDVQALDRLSGKA